MKHSEKHATGRGLPEWLHKRLGKASAPKRDTTDIAIHSVSILPRMFGCLDRTLFLNMPVGFDPVRHSKNACVWRPATGKMLLHISRHPSRLSLARLTPDDLKRVLSHRLIPRLHQSKQHIRIDAFRKSFIRYTPTLFLRYTLVDHQGREERFVLYLIRFDRWLYMLSFTGIEPTTSSLAEHICSSVSLKRSVSVHRLL